MRAPRASLLLAAVAVVSVAPLFLADPALSQPPLPQFQYSDGSVTVEVPPEGNPSYPKDGQMENQSDHTAKVKRVASGSVTFDLRFENVNTCDNTHANDPHLNQGGDWAVDYQETYTKYDLTNTSWLIRTGGWVVNAYNWFRHVYPGGPDPQIMNNDTHAFTVIP